MGHRKQSAPHRGSKAYSPRKRSKSPYGRVHAWPILETETPQILGFGGFKAGCTHVVFRENRPNNPYIGHERTMGATILEVPPMAIVGIRAYTNTSYGQKVSNELWVTPPPKSIQRYYKIPETYDFEAKKEAFLTNVDKYSQIRALLTCPPGLTNVGQKDLITHEYGVSGTNIQAQVDFLFSKLGTELTVSDVFREGEYVDVIGVTKGKGFQGPVKRWGVKILQHKSRKTVRGVGTLGPWKPSRIMRTVPRAGQMGLHSRTEYNKLILRIGESGRDITPKGGFNRYGVVKSSYIMLAGSVAGPSCRYVRLRTALRPSTKAAEEAPELVYIDAASE
jgi:large subunit ribosomal protein L3